MTTSEDLDFERRPDGVHLKGRTTFPLQARMFGFNLDYGKREDRPDLGPGARAITFTTVNAGRATYQATKWDRGTDTFTLHLIEGVAPSAA